MESQIVKQALIEYFDKTLTPHLKEIVEGLIKSRGMIQDCLPISEICMKYDLSKRTLYNYHNKGYIKLYSSEGRTYASVSEMEAHLKAHPVVKIDQELKVRKGRGI